jgi:hypothetical protein
LTAWHAWQTPQPRQKQQQNRARHVQQTPLPPPPPQQQQRQLQQQQPHRPLLPPLQQQQQQTLPSPQQQQMPPPPLLLWQRPAPGLRPVAAARRAQVVSIPIADETGVAARTLGDPGRLAARSPVLPMRPSYWVHYKALVPLTNATPGHGFIRQRLAGEGYRVGASSWDVSLVETLLECIASALAERHTNAKAFYFASGGHIPLEGVAGLLQLNSWGRPATMMG